MNVMDFPVFHIFRASTPLPVHNVCENHEWDGMYMRLRFYQAPELVPVEKSMDRKFLRVLFANHPFAPMQRRCSDSEVTISIRSLDLHTWGCRFSRVPFFERARKIRTGRFLGGLDWFGFTPGSGSFCKFPHRASGSGRPCCLTISCVVFFLLRGSLSWVDFLQGNQPWQPKNPS